MLQGSHLEVFLRTGRGSLSLEVSLCKQMTLLGPQPFCKACSQIYSLQAACVTTSTTESGTLKLTIVFHNGR
jgi:hypothetical protein